MAATASSSKHSNTTTNTKTDPKFLKHKRRLCQVEGCTKIVKSQGRCQRHGAKPKSCRVTGCVKQAQGNFDGMCKSHFHQNKQAFSQSNEATVTAATTSCTLVPPDDPSSPPPVSVYDTVLPACISWKASPEDSNEPQPFPLVSYLADNFHRGTAWHRNDERVARGLPKIPSSATQLEGWERELVWTEILLLTGHPDAVFRHLARAWGRDKGFHRVLGLYICQRHGSVERKRKREISNTTTTVSGATELPQEDESGEQQAAKRPTTSTEVGANPSSCTVAPVADEIAANVWDSASYYGTEYNEALAATLLDCVDMDDDDDEGSDDSSESDRNAI